MSEKVDIYMPIYIGDYMSDTSELAAEEHGAYLLLLMAAWKRGGRLPTEPDRLCRLAAVPEKRWLKVWGMIARFFTLDGDAFVQARLTKELAKAASRRASASANGRASAEARRAQRETERTDNEDANGKSTGVGTGVPAAGATEQPADGQRKSNSSKSGSLALSDSAALGADQTSARSEPRAKLWAASDWFRKYGIAWRDRYSTWPGDDSKASGRLADILAGLTEGERLAAQERAPQMLAEFLANADDRTVGRRHPWSFFVTEWTGLRVPKLAAAHGRAPALPTTVDMRR